MPTLACILYRLPPKALFTCTQMPNKGPPHDRDWPSAFRAGSASCTYYYGAWLFQKYIFKVSLRLKTPFISKQNNPVSTDPGASDISTREDTVKP
jgi:hypothetical protein